MNAQTIRLLFSGEPTPINLGLPIDDLNGNRPVIPRILGTDDLVIDWDFFFELSELDGRLPLVGRNISRKFDTLLSPSMLRLRRPAISDLPVSLAERNLRRGRAFLLPSGQSVARVLGIEPITDLNIPNEVVKAQDALKAENGAIVDIRENTPLWYYILREAEVADGKQLTGVGAWIVAETFIGLLLNDPDSILNNDFTPQPGLKTMASIAKLFN